LNIVADQRDYSSQNSETTKMFQNIVDPRKNIFQGDITGIHPDSALENPVGSLDNTNKSREIPQNNKNGINDRPFPTLPDPSRRPVGL
jgi:hypothetical protein